ncbi:MAG: urease accessory protein UreF [Gammaproteobacteria bacterium]|nr:urease accessory protein UreF [Gammaproteobacteria bacterium]
MATPTEKVRLWQLISPLSPVGAYHHSQGLEEAVGAGWVSDEGTALAWIHGLLGRSIANLDLPVVARARTAWRDGDVAALRRWDALCRACRETSEQRAEERNMGAALVALLGELGERSPDGQRLGYPAAFGVAAFNASLGARDTLAGFAWAWCENQVACAVKLIPLGHSAGQRMLRELGASLDAVVEHALAVADDEIGLASPGLAIASALHETRHTRLYRS